MFEEDLGIEAERAEKGEFKKGLFLVVSEAYMTVFQRLDNKNTLSLAEKGEFKKGLFLVVGEAYMTVFQRLAHKNTRSLCGCFHFV